MEIGFIIGATIAGVLLGILSNWLYDLSKRAGLFPDRPTLKRFVSIVFLFLPIVIIAVFPDIVNLHNSNNDQHLNKPDNQVVTDAFVSDDKTFEIFTLSQGDIYTTTIFDSPIEISIEDYDSLNGAVITVRSFGVETATYGANIIRYRSNKAIFDPEGLKCEIHVLENTEEGFLFWTTSKLTIRVNKLP